MRLLSELRYVLRQLNRSWAERELEDEIRSHMEIEIQQMIENGMSPEEAQRAALRAFGSIALSKERSRKMWGLGSLETLWQDIKYAFRMLGKNRSFAAVAIITL